MCRTRVSRARAVVTSCVCARVGFFKAAGRTNACLKKVNKGPAASIPTPGPLSVPFIAIGATVAK